MKLFSLPPPLQPAAVVSGYVSQCRETASVLQGPCNQSAPSVSRRPLAATQWWAVRSVTVPGPGSSHLTSAVTRSAGSAGTTKPKKNNRALFLFQWHTCPLLRHLEYTKQAKNQRSFWLRDLSFKLFIIYRCINSYILRMKLPQPNT